MTDDSDDDTKPETPLSLSQPSMTAQLQFALRLLAMPTSALPNVIATWQDENPDTIAALAPDEVDPFDEYDDLEWVYFAAEPLPQRGADVWIFGNPPQIRVNGRALPRMKVVFDDSAMTRSAAEARRASWFVRALRTRASTFERVVAAAVALRPDLATAPDPSALKPVRRSAIADAVGMHVSTIDRVVSVCRFQNLHGVMRFVPKDAHVGFACEDSLGPD